MRDSGVPVLHLAEDLEPRLLDYARSVDAGWVCYPAPEASSSFASPPGEPAISSVARAVLP